MLRFVCPDSHLRTRALRLAAFLFLFVAALWLTAPAAEAAGGCSLPVNTGTPKTSDCLYILNTAVELKSCALCVCDVNDSGGVTAGDALLCLKVAVGLDIDLDCPECAGTTTTTVTTTTLTGGDADSCPGFVEWTTHAAFGDECSTNADCDAGDCDQDSGRCHTATELDLGWTGTAHDVDLDEGATLRLDIDCNLSGGICGVCSIDGVDPSLGNCRCEGDIRTLCDSPFQLDTGCPACVGGAFPGRGCQSSSECSDGPCAAHCAFDPEIVCSTNSDCPTGRKHCDSEPRCGDGEGKLCSNNAQCLGTCGGSSMCQCYDSPPIPVASVEFPFCILPRLASDVTGTVNVETGAGSLTKNLEVVAYTGLSLLSPCPVCGGTCNANHTTRCSADADCAPGDTCELDVANDGVRDGVCIGGANDGDDCDMQATNGSFPARVGKEGGGGYSLDCIPSNDANFTGDGLRILEIESTGTSTLTADEPCNPNIPSAGNCPCLVCSGGSEQPCHSDADCTSVLNCTGWPQLSCDGNSDCQDINVGTCTTFNNTRCSGNFTKTCTSNTDCTSADFGTCSPGTCSSAGSGTFPESNACTDLQCTAGTDGEGECTVGPNDRFCDGARRADGSAFILCVTNADCSATLIGFNAGTCSVVERRECFPETITATGDIDPAAPVTTSTFCIPPSEGAGKNASVGLPGPGRLVRQSSLDYFCEDSPAIPYTPSGCP